MDFTIGNNQRAKNQAVKEVLQTRKHKIEQLLKIG